MGKVFGIFGTLAHGLAVGIKAVASAISEVVHHPDVIAAKLVESLVHLGFSDEHILTAIERADTAVKTYIEGHEPGWDAATVAVLQHQFVVDSLIARFPSLAVPVAQTLTTVVSKLFALGGSVVEGLLDKAVAYEQARIAAETPTAPVQQ